MFIIYICVILMYSYIPELFSQQADTSLLGLSPPDALKSPYIASMGVYVFKTDVLLNLLKCTHPTSNDFGSEIIPAAVRDHNVQVRENSIHLSSFKCFCTLEF